MNNIGSGERQLNLAQKYCQERRPWLLAQCRLILKRMSVLDFEDKAEDLTHEVFILCGSRSDEEWEEVANHDGYLYTVAKNKAYLDLKNGREEATDSEKLARMIESRDSQRGQSPADTEWIAIYLKQLWGMLSTAEQDLLNLLWEGFKYQEIGKKLGLSDDAARQRISRMGKKLRRLVEAGDKDPP